MHLCLTLKNILGIIILSMKIASVFAAILFVLLSLHPVQIYAQTSTPELDESFDPFSDYNEFEQETEEEADINFLRNGRYLTLGLVGGYRDFTGGFSQGYEGALNYGVQFSYFFDLNLATALSYTTGDHGVFFRSFNDPQLQIPTGRIYSGNVNIQIFDLHLKYYINTDNVTKGLADLNPYLFLGSGMYVRTYNLNESFNNDPDRVLGFRLGSGIEFPIVQRRFYIGAQALYNYVQFPDENNDSIDESLDGETPNPKPVSPRLNGDFFEINIVLGVNF